MYQKINWDETKLITAQRLDDMDSGTFNAYYQSENTFIENATINLIYGGGNLTQINESVAGVLMRRTTLSYEGGRLISSNVKIYSDGTAIIKEYTDTINYTGDNITSIGRVVI